MVGALSIAMACHVLMQEDGWSSPSVSSSSRSASRGRLGEGSSQFLLSQGEEQQGLGGQEGGTGQKGEGALVEVAPLQMPRSVVPGVWCAALRVIMRCAGAQPCCAV